MSVPTFLLREGLQPTAAIMDEVLNETMDLVNACQNAYGEHDGNKKYRIELIQATLKRADEEVAAFFLNIPGHPRRPDFMTLTKVAHRAQIPTHIGPVGSVRIGPDGDPDSSVLAEPWPASEIEKIRENVGAVAGGIGLYVVGPKYDIVDNRLYIVSDTLAHVGYVDIANLKTVEMGTMMSPPEYSNAVIATALKMMFGKDAAETELQGSINFKKIAAETLNYVAMGKAVPPMAQDAIGGM